MRTLSRWSGALCIAAICSSGWGAEINSGLTKTRPEMKKRIEALKEREARIPLPALTAEEIASGKRSVNNGRLRSTFPNRGKQIEGRRRTRRAGQPVPKALPRI
jgi:hypothetical protein